MKPPSAGLVVLDTSIFVHYARDDATARMIEEQYALTSRKEKPLLSSIVEGEILGFAEYRGWGKPAMDQLRRIFDQLVRVNAGEPEIVAQYSGLYVLARHAGQAMWEHQNDLWIAATAMAAGAEIYTCDGDFDWLHPHQLTVIRIQECR